MRHGVRVAAAVCAALLVAPAARAADKEAIQRAVDRGVAYLKGIQAPDGTWRYTEIGATALAGLALVESGVPPNDPAVQKAAQAVRAASVSCTKTYSLSLAIMFLDVLGDRTDDELIESMAVRLLAGQYPQSGGWGYACPPLASAEAQRLQGALQQHNELVARPEPPASPKGRPSAQDLPKEIQEQLRLVNVQQQALPAFPGDNSNTQFAVLALWIARRRGIPVEAALQRIDARFRTSQRPEGGWDYQPGVPDPYGSTPQMTCAGLLGLALAHGSALEATLHTGRDGGAPARGGAAPDIGKDPVIRKALLGLGAAVVRPFGNSPPTLIDGEVPVLGPQTDSRVYYFFFSLERVAVIYGLETVGDRDWYTWGADYLLRHQKGDGSWAGENAAPGSDTSFALLFLRRANLAQDLTATLKGRVQDPAHREMRAVDLDNLNKGPGPKPAAGAAKEARPAAPAADPEVVRLSDELVKADAARQGLVLRALRDGKGSAYTDALAHAIHRMDGAVQGQARDALADRLTRMTAATLDDKLRDDDLEVRRAAALACAMKDEKGHVPRLIVMLQDPEPAVAHAAHAALKSLTGQDLGPGKDATPAEVAAAGAAWKDWWAKNGRP